MKRMMVHLVMVSAFFLLFSCMGTTPANYTIDGTVKLWNGTPLAGVTIIAGQATTTTDESGNWRIEGLTGTIVVKAEKDDYYIVVAGTNYYTSIEVSNERTIHFTAYSETEEFGGGDGTQENPYIVVNAQQLQNMADHMPDSPDSTPLYFTQIRDIDLSDVDRRKNVSLDLQANWVPLGASNQPYICVYNGSGFSIKNMVVVDNGSLGNGFFHALEKSVIMNVVFENATIVATGAFHEAGVLAANVYECTVDNVKVFNSRIILVGTYFDAIGGLVGATEDSTITDCFVSGMTIEAQDGTSGLVGGLVGSVRGSHFDNDSLQHVKIEGIISESIGGFIADANQSTFNICETQAEIRLSANAYSSIGGFVARAYACSFENCYAIGTASIDNPNATDVGGFAGYTSNDSSFTDCRSEITFVLSGSAATNLGGFVGSAYSASFRHCEVAATLSASGCYNLGGFAGYSDGSSAENCAVEASLAASECDYSGGFVAYSKTNDFTNCTFKGRVEVGTSSSQNGYVSGFAAYAFAETRNSVFEGCRVLSGSWLILTADRATTNYLCGLIGYGYGTSPNAKLKLNNSYVRSKYTKPSPNVNDIISSPLGSFGASYVETGTYDAVWEE